MNSSLATARLKPHPEWLLRFYAVQGYVVTPVSAACCVLLITVVLRFTPRAMGAFKWYIIASSVGSLFCELLIGFGHPLPLFPYPLLLSGGLLPLLDLPPAGNNVYAGSVGLSFLVMMYCNASMFVFRFGQTVDSRRIKLMAVPKYGFGLAISFIGVFGVGMMLPLSFSMASYAGTRRYAEVADPALYALIKDRPFIGLQKLQVDGWILMITVFGVLFIGSLTFAMVGSAVGCQYALRSSLLAFEIFFIPGLIVVASFLLNMEHANTIAVMMLSIIELYPLATNILILSYVKPYRRGVLQFIRHHAGVGAEPSSATQVKPIIK